GHRREEQPVAERGCDGARGRECGSETLLRARIERSEQRSRRAKERLREKGRVHERLAIGREVQKSRRPWVDALRNRLNGERSIPAADRAFRAAIRAKLEPRRESREEPPDGLQVRHGPPVGAGGL